MTVLMDKEIMQRNIHALGLQSLSSVDIIKRLRYHISSVGTKKLSVCVNETEGGIGGIEGRGESEREREREMLISQQSFIQLQCNLYGHYSLDDSLSLLVLPTLNSSLELLVSHTS